MEDIGNKSLSSLDLKHLIIRGKMVVDIIEYCVRKDSQTQLFKKELMDVYEEIRNRYGRLAYLQAVDEISNYGKIKRGEEVWPKST